MKLWSEKMVQQKKLLEAMKSSESSERKGTKQTEEKVTSALDDSEGEASDEENRVNKSKQEGRALKPEQNKEANGKESTDEIGQKGKVES